LILIIDDLKKPKSPDIWVANVGDSTVYGAQKNSDKPIKISKDHKPSLKAEIARMQSCDKFDGIHEGYVKTQNGDMLAVSRALGDGDFGEMVTWEPTIKQVRRNYDAYILASDGIWDVMNCNQVWSALNHPKELREWKYSAGRLNHTRNQKYDQHDNTSLILIYIDLEKHASAHTPRSNIKIYKPHSMKF
jgi:serine/threonine protein phosphatase PrpC